MLVTGTNQVGDLSPLASLTRLEYLNVAGNTGVTSIAALTGLGALRTLWLGNNAISDFSPLASLPKLELLAIANCGFSTADIQHVKGITTLKFLGFFAEPELTD